MAQQQEEEEEEAAAAAATEEVTPILVPYLGAPLPGEVAVVRVEAEGAASRGPDGAGVERMGARPRDHVEAALRLIEPSAADAPSLVDAGGGGSCGCVREAMKTELCGFELMKVVALLASVVLPLLDASSDWGVTATFYANDDINWFKAGLTIQLIAGSFAGLFLCCFLGKETGSTGCCVSCGLFRCLERVTDEIREMCGVCAYMCCGLLPIILVTLALCVVMGMAGLAPVAVAIITLRHGYQMSESSSWSQEKTKQDSQLLKLAKGMELVLEAVPQSLLQTYIGVSYGQINPSSEYFNPVLASSIGLSLFGAALTLFGLEMEFRNDKGDVTIKLGTRYGLVTLLLRASQLGAAIFWVALLGCGIKEGALTLVVLTVWLFVWILIESMMLREGDRDKPAGCEVCCFFCCVPTYFCLRIPMGSVLAPAVLWATHLALVGSMATMFYRRQHVPNNYAAYPNMSAPVGLPGDENHYDCHDRTSGIYPGVLCACGSVVFGLLSLMMDPKHGNKRCMGLSYAERRLRAFKAASVGMNDQQTTVAMILQIWKWADIGRDGRLSAQDVDRWIRETEIAVEDEEGTPARITDITMLSHDILGNPMYTPPPVNPNDKPIPRPREPTRDQFILWYSAAWQKRLAVPAMQFVPADNTVGSPWLKGQLAKICTSHESAAPTYQYVQLRKDPVKQSLRDVLRKELIMGSVGWCVKGVSAKDPSGKVGEVTINPDGDGDVKLRYADGTESGYLKASSLSPTVVSERHHVMVAIRQYAAIRRFVVFDPDSADNAEGFDSSGNECWPDWCEPATRAQLEVDGLYKRLGDVYRPKSLRSSPDDRAIRWCVKGVSAKDPSGKVGEVTINPDGDGEVQLRYADGTESGYLKASSLSPTGVLDDTAPPFMRGKSFKLDDENVIRSQHPMAATAQHDDTFEFGQQAAADESSDFAVNDLVWFHKSATVERAAIRWCVKGVSAKDPSGKVGEVTINPDGDGDVKLRYADGTESGYLKASSLSPTGVSDSMESEEKIYHDSLLAKGDREYLCKFVAGRVVQVHHANAEEASVADQAPLPGGSWKRTARNYEVRQGLTAEHPATLHAELQKADGTWTQATVDMKEDRCECFANTDGKFTTAEPEPPQLNFNGRSYSIEWVETGSLRTTRHPASAVRATKPGRHAIVIRKLEPTEGEWRVGDLRRVRDYAKDVHTDGVSTDGYTDVVDLVRPLADGSDATPPGAEHLYGVPVEDLIDPRAVPDDGTVDAYTDSNTTPCELDMVAGQRFDLFRQTLWEDVLRLRHEVKGLIARDISRFLASVDPVPAVYEVGTKVEGQYVGEAWYPGTIAAVDDAGASYTLDWDDGDQEERKQPAERVRLPQRSAEPLPLSSQERIDAMAAIDARIEDHWDPAWGSSSVLDGFGSVQVRRRYIAAVDAVLARYDTAERFATLDVNDLVSDFGFESAHRDKLREYRNQTDEPPVITGVKESQLERVSREEWDKHMPLILKRRLGHPACRELVEAHFNDRLELALPRKGRGGSGLLGTLLGLD